MKRKTGIKAAVLLGVSVIALVQAACTAGVSQQDYDALKQQLVTREQEVASLKQQIEAAKAGGQPTAALEKQLADLKKQSVWRINPDAKPRATPVPLAPGATPAPPPHPPAARTVPIAFYVDTVTAAAGESKYNVDASLGCVRTGVFKRGQRIVWRMEITDISTGKVLQASDVDRAVLKLANGETLNLAFGRHGATVDSPWFWAVGWDIPPDFPLGNLDYSIEVATKDGKTGTFKELTLLSSAVESIQTSRPDPDKWKMTNAGLMIIE